MKEALFALYLLSGLVKAVFLMYEYEPFIDITPVIALLFFILVARDIGIKKNFSEIFEWQRFRRTWPFALFSAWLVITLLYSPSEHYGYKKAFLFLTNVVAFAIPFLMPSFRMKAFRNAFIVMSALLGLVFILGYPDYPLQQPSILGVKDFRIFGSYYLSVAMFIGIAVFLAIDIRDYRVRLVVMSLLLILLIGTAGRGPIVFTIFLLLIYLGMNFKHAVRKLRDEPKATWKFTLFFLLFNGLAYLACTNITRLAVNYHRTAFRFGIMMKDPKLTDLTMESNEELADMGGGKLSKEEKANRDRTSKNISIVKRKEHYGYAVRTIFDSARGVIFGYGLGSYGIMKEQKDGRLYPHNIFLEIWFELGLIGLLLFSFMMLWILYRMLGVPAFMNLILVFILFNLQKSLSLVDLRVFFAFCSIVLFYPVVVNLPFSKRLKLHA